MNLHIGSRPRSWALPSLVLVTYTGFAWFMFDWFTMRGSFQSSSSSLYPPRPAPHFPKDPLDFICVPKSPVPQPGRDDHTSVYSQLETASAIRNDNVQRQQFLMQGDPRNPAGALAFRQPHVMETWEPLYHCPFEERVGPYGDGGKWMCRVRDYTDPSCVIYSFGSFSDLRWERDVARLTQCSVHIYDPTPHVVDFMKVVHSETDATSTLNTVANTMSISALPRRTQYHPWAFYEPSNVLATTFLHKVFPNFTGGNLRWIVENTGSGVPQIIKMDVEGSELFIDFKADADLWTQVHMFLVEVHFSILTEWIQTGFYNVPLGPNPEWTFFSGWINTLYDLGFHMFHKEINLFVANGGVWEIAFVNTKMF